MEACFGGLLLVPAGTPKNQETARIQTLFVSGMPVENKGDTSEEEDIVEREEDTHVATFTTTQ